MDIVAGMEPKVGLQHVKDDLGASSPSGSPDIRCS